MVALQSSLYASNTDGLLTQKDAWEAIVPSDFSAAGLQRDALIFKTSGETMICHFVLRRLLKCRIVLMVTVPESTVRMR
jgi:hypothetical protein